MKKILLLGANGYIGSHLTKYLVNSHKEFEVIAVSRHNTNIKDVDCKFIKFDIRESETVENAYEFFGKPDICIDLAWENNFDHQSECHLLNAAYHYAFLKKIMGGGVYQVCVTGSFREYGNFQGKVSESYECEPLNLYTLGKKCLKRALEIYAIEKNICLQWVRPFTVWGDEELNGSILNKILKWEAEGKKTFPFTMGDEMYDYIHVNDLVQDIVSVISQNCIGGVINLGSGQPTRLKDKVEQFILDNNLAIRPEYGAYKRRDYDTPVIYADMEKLEDIKSRW